MNPLFTDSFTLDTHKIGHTVYVEGAGPAVILMHEITGMTPEFVKLAKHIAERGFRVYLPHFFGPIGKSDLSAGIVYCLRHELNVFTSHGKSPVAEWLRGLCRRADAECGNHGVGVIGLCLTGSIVISLMVEPCVRVPVMCEPALPFVPFNKALGIPEEDIILARNHVQAHPILAYRFDTDTICTECTEKHFQTLRETFPGCIRLTEIATEQPPFFIPKKSHPVLTGNYPGQDDPDHPVYHVLDEILGELRLRLY